jgi:hypothetical protein
MAEGAKTSVHTGFLYIDLQVKATYTYTHSQNTHTWLRRCRLRAAFIVVVADAPTRRPPVVVVDAIAASASATSSCPIGAAPSTRATFSANSSHVANSLARQRYSAALVSSEPRMHASRKRSCSVMTCHEGGRVSNYDRGREVE